jgi:hypothetical protein
MKEKAGCKFNNTNEHPLVARAGPWKKEGVEHITTKQRGICDVLLSQDAYIYSGFAKACSNQSQSLI